MMGNKPVVVTLEPLGAEHWDAFIRANQEAFNYGALEEFGRRHNFFEEEGQVISRDTVLMSLEHGRAYWLLSGGERVGGLILLIEGKKGELETLFTSPHQHSKGIGYAAWQAVEEAFPEVQVWQTITPYYDQRNIHFYVNRCGFKIVEYLNAYHQGEEGLDFSEQFPQGIFRFEKRLGTD